MSIRYSCFISYAHGQGKIVKSFMEQLKQALVASIELYFRKEVYMDDRHTPGYNFNEGIAQAICESVCMVVVFSPVYSDSNYCLREFLAMENVENKRKQKLGNKFDRTSRMIIPIILRGDAEELPVKIKGINYYDFSKFTLASLKISKKHKEVIETIAKRIYDHYKNMSTINSNLIEDECNKFMLPSEEDALKEWGQSALSIGFPGRSNI
jgi:hypothetical protein